jgi:hypothetical protein
MENKIMIIRTDEYSHPWKYVDLKTGNIWYDGIKPSGGWKFQGFSHIRMNAIIPLKAIQENPEIVESKGFWFKNGKSQFVVRDLEHGTTREWGSRILGISFTEKL